MNRKYEGHDKKLDLQFSEEENHFPACGCKSAATLNNQKNKQHMLVCAPHLFTQVPATNLKILPDDVIFIIASL